MFGRILIVLLVAVVLWTVFGARGSDASADGTVYVVKPADTLWSIAVTHYRGDPRAAVWNVQQRNRLSGTLVTPGQRLVLP